VLSDIPTCIRIDSGCKGWAPRVCFIGFIGLSGFFRVNKVSEDLNFLFESTCKVVLFGKVPAAKKKNEKPDKPDPINRIKRTPGVRTLAFYAYD